MAATCSLQTEHVVADRSEVDSAAVVSTPPVDLGLPVVDAGPLDAEAWVSQKAFWRCFPESRVD
jgi:hypothetical protein